MGQGGSRDRDKTRRALEDASRALRREDASRALRREVLF